VWTRSTNGPTHRYLAAERVVTSELIFNVAGDVGDLKGCVKHRTQDDEIGYSKQKIEGKYWRSAEVIFIKGEE
jgi:ATP-dependent protease Clp ATPase subunit